MIKGSEAITILGKKISNDFSISEEPRLSIYRNCYEKFIKRLEKYNTEKSIALIGSIGVGKTTMMKIMQKLFKDSESRFMWVTGRELNAMLEDYTVSELIERYGKSLKMDLYIDDIGIGNSSFHKYGNSINIISEILLDRYELFCSEGFKTHISSNIPLALDKAKYPNVMTLMDMYGDRVIDRIKEMCDITTWQGKSLRK
jgi:DNA replication protein DnaC